MSAQRQQRKLNNPAFWAGAGITLLLVAGLLLPPSGRAATTELIVVDENRGLALSGFDPVGYFTDARPLLGRDDMELSFAGAIWRFRNEGNRAAFIANPEVYLPVFGGYDPVAVARGVATPGHPQIWLIIGKRLYLFYDAAARKTFVSAPEATATMAEKKWPAVLQTISP